MLGKKMTNKETFESLKMDARIINNTTFEELKEKYIYTTKAVVPDYRTNLKIDLPENVNQPIQLLCQYEKQNERNLEQLSIDFERLDKSQKDNQ